MQKILAWEADGRVRGSSAFALAVALAFACTSGSFAQSRPDLVSRDRFRVCGDPANMPFSNKAGEGFENKIAAIVADELKVPLHYYWVPHGPGFVRNTLGTDLCDVIIGYVSGADIVDHTNPYYASAYVLVTRKDGTLKDVRQLADPRLKDKRLGVVAATPPADHLLRLGLTEHAKTYALLVDRRFASPAEEALADLTAGVIDAAILWGPIGGYFAQKSSVPLIVTPLLNETERPEMAFRITFGIRPLETDWKHRLNAVIRRRQKGIDAVLASYGVPFVPVTAVRSEPPSRASETSQDIQ